MKEDSSPSRTKKPKAMPRKAHGGQSHINGDAPDGAFEEVEANASLRRGGSFKAPSLKYCSSKYFAGAAAAGASNFETTSPSRSHSCRRPRRPRDLEISSREYRPRALSMPSKGMHGRPRHPEHADDSESGAIGPDNVENNDDEYLMKVRSFTLSSKGLKNRGDSTKRKSRSNQSVKSSENYVMTEQEFRERASSVTSMGSGAHCDSSSDISGDGEVPPYKVVMLGAPKVGRTALARQFLTSEYLGAFDTSIDDGIEKSVSVLLDGKETEMRILEPPAEQQETGLHGDADAVIMVYSLADRASYQYATDVLFKLRNDYVSDQAIILVGNKADIVRARTITQEEGRATAMAYDCKFIETSALLNDQVDELLVATLRQIRLKEKERKKKRKKEQEGCVTKTAREIISLFWRKDRQLSKSCDDLYGMY